MELIQFEKEYRIHVYETGPNGKLSLYSLFNYMQDIAAEHAVKLGFGRDDLMRDNRFWVLSRMFSVISELPSWENTIILKTWPNGTDKLFALRNYEVMYPDGRHIASGTSSWLILDQTTKKVQRPDGILQQYNPGLRFENREVRYASKLDKSAENGKLSAAYKIKVSDLDVNFHTNNVKYLNWVYDSYTLEFMMHNLPQSVEINYLAESKFDEEVIIRSSQDRDSGNIYSHSIFRTFDYKELCRIRIEWRGDENK
jgi:medium-chain acyl-[acyl-carrier-protein] hydrolase